MRVGYFFPEQPCAKLTDLVIAVVNLIEDFSMVSFLKLESQNEDSVQSILSYIDDCIGWSEVQEPQLKDDPDTGFEEAE